MIYPFSPDSVRRANPQVSFPSELSDEILAEYGVFPVRDTIKPSGEVVTQGQPELVNGEWRQTWTVTDFSAEQRKAMIAARRYQEEIRGITVNGALIKTDHQSQMKMIGAALAARIDPNKVRKWKAGGGFVDIDAATTIAVAQAVDAHVQACFDREAELVAAVDAGTYTSDMLNEGWPK